MYSDSRARCNSGTGDHPLYVNVDMTSGDTLTSWVDSLQAAFPAVQLLAGDVEEAICHHALFYAIWKRYDGPADSDQMRAVEAETAKIYMLQSS